jgi:uncharacterized protein (TIGR02147 family)
MAARKFSQPPDLFQYLDYRAFLSAYFQHRKFVDSEFSLRVFARLPELSLSSSSFISAVLKKRKNLSQNLRLRFGRALKLKPEELDYFDLLVRANQSKSAEEKHHFLAQLSRFHSSQARVLPESDYRFYERWHYSVVWNYFGLHQDKNNPAVIARALHPEVAPQQVEEAVKLLLELKLIKRMANGYAVTDKHLTTEKGFRGEAARRHNGEFIRLALDGLESVPAEARQYNVMTLSVSRRGFERVREKINTFRAELRELVESDEGEDRIYALALQLFPCTKGGWDDGDVVGHR